MKFAVATCMLLGVNGVAAFAPAARFAVARAQPTARPMAFDPSVLQDLPHHISSIQDAFSSISLSDATTVGDAVQSVVPAAADAATTVGDAVQSVVPAAADAAVEAAGTDNGWFGFLTGPTQGLLELIHSALVTVGFSQDAWGASIIVLTMLIKVITFPLTKTQLESTGKMQALQPVIKDIQAKYQSNPEVMNQKIAEVYQTNQVNPLAGCIPSLVQIPVFIGLYRAVLDLAKENALDEPFLFLPNLEGPTYGADPSEGSSWLFNWVDGVPPLGWDDTGAFLILPVFLVISQFVSMELMTPKDQKPQEGNFILKLLPFLIGWFSLNVPAALCVYWVTNNVVTTATSLVIRSGLKMEPAAVAAAPTATSTTAPPATEIFAPPPMRERPAGFSSGPAAPVIDADGVKTLTVTDAEIVEESKTEEPAPVVEARSKGGKKKRRNKKKKKN